MALASESHSDFGSAAQRGANSRSRNRSDKFSFSFRRYEESENVRVGPLKLSVIALAGFACHRDTIIGHIGCSFNISGHRARHSHASSAKLCLRLTPWRRSGGKRPDGKGNPYCTLKFGVVLRGTVLILPLGKGQGYPPTEAAPLLANIYSTRARASPRLLALLQWRLGFD